MQVLARIPALPTDARFAASPPGGSEHAGPIASAPPAPSSRRPATRAVPSRSAIPDWSIAALAAVAIAVWSLAAWRDAGTGRPDRVAVDPSAPSDPAAARTR